MCFEAGTLAVAGVEEGIGAAMLLAGVPCAGVLWASGDMALHEATGALRVPTGLGGLSSTTAGMNSKCWGCGEMLRWSRSRAISRKSCALIVGFDRIMSRRPAIC
jgi:hypothetical protein